jgi:hypothetical protein
MNCITHEGRKQIELTGLLIGLLGCLIGTCIAILDSDSVRGWGFAFASVAIGCTAQNLIYRVALPANS